MEEIPYLGATIQRWTIGSSTFLAWPERGARLMNWNIAYPDGTFRDVIRWPDLSETEQFVKARGGNPILFPFAARTFLKGDIHHWEDSAGTKRPMPMHGIARQGEFELSRIDPTGFAARLQPDLPARQSYPYEYDFDVIYRFAERSLDVELRLTNHDSNPIPWSAGHHFYFNLPWSEGTRRSDYQIEVPAKKACRHGPDGGLVDLKAFATTDTLANNDLVDRIHYQLTSPTVTCRCLTDDTETKLTIGSTKTPDPGYALVTWTEGDDSPYYCIEPWMGPPNSPEHKIGLHWVKPGQSKSFSVKVEV